MSDTDARAKPPPGPPHDTEPETHGESSRAAHAPGDEHDSSAHGAADHGGDHGHDDHGHGVEPLGPVDVWAWGAGALGVAIAAVTVLCFAMATSTIAPA